MGPSLSIILVSYNTASVLRECLTALFAHSKNLTCEVLIIDNDSKDGSQDVVKNEFPDVWLIESKINLGFAAASNLGFKLARGRYIVMLNSDAILHPDSLKKAFKYMEDNPLIGLGGGRLVGKDGSWQPSARKFPSLLNDFLHLSGLAARFPASRFFGRADATWKDPLASYPCDWIPGAFVIARKEVLDKVNYFDERFFLYFEEVDLCKRIKKQHYAIEYWGDITVTHYGGESSKTQTQLALNPAGSQLTLWRMRSQLLYYRKHGGRLTVWLSAQMEIGWHRLRAWKNRKKTDPQAAEKVKNAEQAIRLMQQAWNDTKGGTTSPPTPW